MTLTEHEHETKLYIYIDPILMTPQTRLKCFMNTKMNINTTRKKNIMFATNNVNFLDSSV